MADDELDKLLLKAAAKGQVKMDQIKAVSKKKTPSKGKGQSRMKALQEANTKLDELDESELDKLLS